MNILLFPSLIILTFLIFVYILYQNTNRYFKLGYARSSKVIKNFYPILQKRTESMNIDKKISYIKDEVYNLVAKPLDIANLMNNQNIFEKEINVLKSRKEEIIKRLKEERVNKFNQINFRLSESIASLEIKRNNLDESKEKILDEIIFLEDQIKQNELVLFDKAKAVEESNFKPEIECKSGHMLKRLVNWISQFYDILKKDILLLVPIIILLVLIVVDYYVGTAFVIDQYRGDLFEASGVDRLLINVKIYSMAFMVFGVVLLMIEFANNKLFNIYQNTFVQGLKWLFSSLIVGLTFLGVAFYLGATRFFAGDMNMQSKLEDIGLILVWFGLVFVCSLLFNEIRNSSRGFSPIITIFEAILAPFVFVALIVFILLWMIEYVVRYLAGLVNLFLPQSRVLEKAIKVAKKKVEDYERRVARMEAAHEQRIISEKQIAQKQIEKLEIDYKQKAENTECEFVEKIDRLNFKIKNINATEALFREGSDSAVVNLWGKYIF